MSFSSWLSSWKRSAAAAPRRTQTSPSQRATFRPTVKPLEDRRLLSTLTVTSTKDSGAGSLRAELAAARSGDTIIFSPRLNGTTITLTSGELDLTKNLTIQGPGAGQLTISGGSSTSQHGWKTITTGSRIFDVTQNATVTLSGLTISKGNGVASASSVAPEDGDGGGILNHGTLTVSGCTVSSNTANGGGGIFSDGTLTVSGGAVSGNGAYYGGGIYSLGGTVTMGDSSTLSANGARFGGGIYNSGGTVTVSNHSTLSGNTAYHADYPWSGGDGGAIYNSGGTVAISNSTLSGNTADVNFGSGGAIYNSGGTVTISNSTLSSNTALYGGGIFSNGTVTVKNSSRMTGNTAGDLGADVFNLGVLYLDSTSTIGILDGNPAILTP